MIIEYWQKGKRFLTRFLAIMNNLVTQLLYGTDALTVMCPICHWRGKHFIDFDCGYGNIYRNADCPWCHSQPRHRLLYFFLQDVLNTNSSIRFLHFSPEKCIQRIIRKHRNVAYVSADIEPRKAMRQENVERLSFASNSFDIILCLDVLEHVIHDDLALKELLRVLTPSGICVIDVPIEMSRKTTYQDPTITTPQEKAKAYWQSDHVRLYGRNFPQIVRQAGFHVSSYYAKEFINNHDLTTFGLPKLPLYICTHKNRSQRMANHNNSLFHTEQRSSLSTHS